MASQAFDPVSRGAVNRAEYLGGDIWVSAYGSYDPLVSTQGENTLSHYMPSKFVSYLIQQDDSECCPKLIQANIEGGLLSLWDWTFPLPIKGSGTFEVTYLDDELRIFRSGSSLSVQVKINAINRADRR